MLQNRPRRRIDADNDNEPELGQHHSAARPSFRLRSGRTRLLLCLWYHSPALTRLRKGQTGRPGTARRGRASRDCAALAGLEPREPNCNSPLPSRMVDEHRRQPVCTTVAVTKRWHGEAGVWRNQDRSATHVCSTEADGDATTFSPAHHRQKKHHGRQHWRDWQDLHASTH